MNDSLRIPVLVPLAIGATLVALTLAIHALAVMATVQLFRREKISGRAGSGIITDFSILFRVNGFAFFAHVVEINLWAILFMMCGEFGTLELRFTIPPSITRRSAMETS